MATSSCQHGMSSYAPCTALGKPTENRHSNSPRRCYRGQPRRYLYYRGGPRDPRISPEQLLAKKARSSRRPNSRPPPEGTPQPNSSRKGIIVCIRLDPRPNSEGCDRRMSPKIFNCLLKSRLRQTQLLPARNTLVHSERGSRRAKKKRRLDRVPKHV